MWKRERRAWVSRSVYRNADELTTRPPQRHLRRELALTARRAAKALSILDSRAARIRSLG